MFILSQWAGGSAFYQPVAVQGFRALRPIFLFTEWRERSGSLYEDLFKRQKPIMDDKYWQMLDRAAPSSPQDNGYIGRRSNVLRGTLVCTVHTTR